MAGTVSDEPDGINAELTCHPADPFDEIERALDEIRRQQDVCRQAMILSRAAVALGLVTLVGVLTIARAYNTATVVFAALTAVIGGLVWLGANKSSRADLDGKRAGLEAQQDDLFRHVEARNGWSRTRPTLH